VTTLDGAASDDATAAAPTSDTPTSDTPTSATPTSDTPTSATPTSAPEESPRRLRALPPWLLAVAALVVAGGAGLRLWGLGRQSYWTDELFSVSQAQGGIIHALGVGLQEVHTPFYAVLLLGWETLAGDHGTALVWTRLLSALFGLLSIVAAWATLRRAALSAEARLLAIAAVAASGFGIVYAQEARMYALVLLAAVGLTGTTLRWALQPAGAPAPRWSWLLWAVLASIAPLFGAVLTLGCLVVLLVVRRDRADRRAALVGTGVALVPQVIWIAAGITRSGFAHQTDWILAPTVQNVWRLLTTVFAAGHLATEDEGFSWASWVGVAVVAGLLLAAAVAGRVGRGARGSASGGGSATGGGSSSPDAGEAVAPAAPAGTNDVRDGYGAVLLLSLVVGILATIFLVSQVVHLWTLRNLIVVSPALSWAVVLGITHLARDARRWAALATLLVLGVGLVAIGVGMRAPYKTDFRGAVTYLTRFRAEHPDATFVMSSDAIPERWWMSSNEPYHPERATQVFSRYKLIPQDRFLQDVAAVPRPAVYIFYPSVSAHHMARYRAQILARVGGPGGCTDAGVHGIVVLACP
jgi:hypothetical protein